MAFNNAGSGHMPAPLADLVIADFDESIRVNLRGTLMAMTFEITAMLDYAGQGIRIDAVAPGPILTDRIASLPEERRAPIGRAVPMGRIGLAEEVAAVVAWLCSDGASFMTGAVVPIDGERLAGA